MHAMRCGYVIRSFVIRIHIENTLTHKHTDQIAMYALLIVTHGVGAIYSISKSMKFGQKHINGDLYLDKIFCNLIRHVVRQLSGKTLCEATNA